MEERGWELSVGVLKDILEGKTISQFPVVQVLSVKQTPPADNGSVRYRLVLSDSRNFQIAMAPSGLYPQIMAEIQKWSIIELTGFTSNMSKNKRVLVITAFTLKGQENGKIGAPISLEKEEQLEQQELEQDPEPKAPPANPQQSLSANPQRSPPQLQSRSPPLPLQPQMKPQPVSPQSSSQRPLLPIQQQQLRPPPPQVQNSPRPQVQNSPRPPQVQNFPRPQPQGLQQQQQQQQQQRPSQAAASTSQRPANQIKPEPATRPSFQQASPSPSQAPRPARPQSFPNGNQRPPPSSLQQSRPAFFPISHLNPYQHRWSIKARVTNKSEKRSWSNQRTAGSLFSIDLLDESGEIRAVGFSAAADKFYDFFEVGRVYIISNCNIKISNKQFSNISNNYEINLEVTSSVEACEDSGDVPHMNFHFVPISQIESLQIGTVIDLLAIVLEGNDLTVISTKKNEDIARRVLTVLDNSNASIKLTLWGKHAENFQSTGFPVIAFKSVKVGEFQGRTLSSTPSTTFHENPEIREAHELRAWFDTQDQDIQPKSLTIPMGPALERMTIEQMRNEPGFGQVEKRVDRCYLRAMLILIKHDGSISYPACSTASCHFRKVAEDAPGQWRCDKCETIFYNCVNRYTLSVILSDFTGTASFRAFDQVGQKLIGYTADQVLEAKADPDQYLALFQDANFKQYNFLIGAKFERHNENARTSFQISQAYDIDYVADCKNLLKSIALYSS